MAEPVMDRLTGQLYHLPGIIGNLGISVANAQKTLNADYIHNIEKLLKMIKDTLGDEAIQASAAANVLRDLLIQLAPSRYQFTETTLEFSADLAERKAKNLQVALGGGFGGVMISAAYARAFAYDYRAAARIKTILHAMPADEKFTGPLLAQAGKIGEIDMPEPTAIEQEIFDGLKAISLAVSKLESAGDGNDEDGQ